MRGSGPRGRQRALEHALLVLPLLVTGWLLVHLASSGDLAVDFGREYWVAGQRVMHGADLYAWSDGQVATGVSFPYPAFTGIAFVPFALVGRGLSDVLFIACSMAALVAALHLFDIRDWRVYGLAFLLAPVVAAWQAANLTLVLLLGIAAVWRYRNRPLVAGALTAALISLKPFTWPALLWLVATRRYRATACGVVIGLAINAMAWWLVGFGEIPRFAHMTGRVSDALYRSGYGVIAFGTHLGLGRDVATGVLACVALAVAGACVLAGRRRSEDMSLGWAVVLMLVASPLVWNHYFVLVLVPIAIRHPRLNAAWLLPLVLWLCPSPGVAAWEIALAWGVTAVEIVALARRRGADAGERITEPVFDGRPMLMAGRTA